MDPITQQLALTSAATGATYVDDVFSIYTYEGNGSAQTITNGIDLSGEGGLVWIKHRVLGYDHHLYDTARGATKYLESNSIAAETTYSPGLTAFGSNSFTLGSGSDVNASPTFSGSYYVSWTFRKAPGFFDVVTYSGSNSTQTIPHSLESKPGMILIKRVDQQDSWRVFHEDIPIHDHLRLNETAAINSQNIFNSTEPTSTHFTVIGNDSGVNQLNSQYVAYLFANDDARFGANSNESIIKCGTYQGNGNTQEINLGFEPQWLMLKNADSYLGDWIMVDINRGWEPSGVHDSNSLCANLSDAEPVNSGRVKLTTQGFKFDNEGNHDYNQTGYSYIYMAIRRPHKPPTAGTDVFTSTGASGVQNAGFPIDTRFDEIISASLDTSTNFTVFDRQRGGYYLVTSTDSAEAQAVNNTSLIIPRPAVGDYYSHTNSRTYVFRRAPRFFDLVCYEGNGTAGKTVTHNLEAVPELMIVKARDQAESWAVYSSAVGATGSLFLDTNVHADTDTGYWNDTAPTAQQFSLGTLNEVNQNTTEYIAYLFATLPGISKVGSYSGSTGNDVDVDCGFSAGPRLVLIKRTDQNASWYFINTISASTDYYNFLDQGVPMSSFDHIDPLSNGFTMKSSAPADLNATGGTYLFLAIA